MITTTFDPTRGTGSPVAQPTSTLASVASPVATAGQRVIQESAADKPQASIVGVRRLAEFKHIFDTPDLTAKFNDFLTNVFMQLDVDKFGKLMREILAKNLSYEATYEELFNRMNEAKAGKLTTIWRQLRSLKVLKETLAGQLGQLMKGTKEVQGYAEVGYTGRLIRQIKSQAGIDIKGSKYAVNDSEKLTDYIECGFPRPYDTFVPLNDHDPLDKNQAIKPSSLDMVVMPIGLHHAPEDKLPAFLDSVNNVLKPGGSFILRDHDAKGRDMQALVSVAHSVFNAATGVPLRADTKAGGYDEISEVRNFRDLTHWQKLLGDHGFQMVANPITTPGDSTDNALMRFVKMPKTPEDHLYLMEQELKKDPEYVRDQAQTYLTTVEWHLVAIAREYAEFIKTKPVHEFPFFKHIALLWKVFIDSCRDGIKASGVRKVITSEYMLMNLFMLVSTTLELLSKGIAYAPLALRKKAKDAQEVTAAQELYKISNDYAQFIVATPFYEYPFFQKIKQMWKAFGERQPGHLFVNFYITAISTIELGMKGLTSWPLYKMYHGVETGKIQLIINDEKNIVSADGNKLTITNRDDAAHLKAIKVDRYRPFVQKIKEFAAQGIDILSIAGQKKVQMKIAVPISEIDYTANIPGINTLSEIAIPSNPIFKFLRLDVEVSKLSGAIKSLQKRNIPIMYIHDF